VVGLDLHDHSLAVKDSEPGVVLRAAQRSIPKINPSAVSERQDFEHVSKRRAPNGACRPDADWAQPVASTVRRMAGYEVCPEQGPLSARPCRTVWQAEQMPPQAWVLSQGLVPNALQEALGSVGW